jgi:hypothetical protein
VSSNHLPSPSTPSHTVSATNPPSKPSFVRSGCHTTVYCPPQPIVMASNDQNSLPFVKLGEKDML